MLTVPLENIRPYRHATIDVEGYELYALRDFIVPHLL